ncbi:type II toxin-antitoxin system Phd/YefM family antitoxin [Chitiniphilus eburneus]|uniref:type II toxin-antitoxin system Phd/YefM family antitoxin n=1 Tax=Chitiniphilus eburneus TaxID=2571148 RepID=UPI0035CF09E0
MQLVMADLAVSISELKRSPSAVLKESNGRPVAVLNHNRPEAYLVPAAVYERMVEMLEDLEDAKLVRERRNEPVIEVSLDDL